ncbi:F420-dependent NADP oxidoreductase, partial [Acinetobacter baumannii]
ANSLSKRVYQYTSKQRLTLHLAAVFACNFSNYCFDMAKQVVDAEQVDFGLLYPLILETAKKATENDPKQMQTGPAMRGDQNILAMHQSLLAQANRDDLKQVYQLLSDGIVKRHHSS